MLKWKQIMSAAAVLGLSVFGLALAACGEENHIHTGAWTVYAEATCEEPAKEKRVCTVCGEEETRDKGDALGHLWDAGVLTATCTEDGAIVKHCKREGCNATTEEPVAALKHIWETIGVTKEPTCTEDGARSAKCTRCGIVEEDQPIPKLGHTLILDVSKQQKQATCEEDGVRHEICTVCNQPVETVLPRLGHLWAAGVTKVEPTCVQPGIEERSCTRCGKSEEVPKDALGHDWEKELDGSDLFTYDKKPTFEEEGEKSIHCTRCSEVKDRTVLPKLEAGKKIEYEFRLQRKNGGILRRSTVSFSVYDGDTPVADAQDVRFTNGLAKLQLEPKTYTVRLNNLPKGYSALGNYTVEAGMPICRMPVGAATIAEEAPDNLTYSEGSVMYDFRCTSVDGTTYTLSELLEQKKLVMLNFFFTTCGPCRNEFPGLNRAYNAYSEDVIVIGIDCQNPRIYPNETEENIAQLGRDLGLSFPLCAYSDIVDRFGVTSAPLSVFIDCEGVVVKIHSGSSSESVFTGYFEQYTNAPYYTRETVIRDFEAVLPEKRGL